MLFPSPSGRRCPKGGGYRPARIFPQAPNPHPNPSPGGRGAQDQESSCSKSKTCMPASRARKSSDRKSTRLNSSHPSISYAVFCLKKKKKSYTVIIVNIHTPEYLMSDAGRKSIQNETCKAE